jgi:RimJ/RimL family protein N-acetyltransferase
MVNVTLQPWSEGDLPLLEKLLGDPSMTEYLGGPESPEQIRKRHQRYLRLPETDHMFKIISNTTSEALGSIGYWEKEWRDQLVYEMGWSVLPEHQGQGIATRAGELVLEHAGLENRHRFMHAFPSVSNAASNVICRKLGFSLLGEYEFEYPPGNLMKCNDWRFDLFGN